MNHTSIKPLLDKVLVLVEPQKAETESGIVIAGGTDEGKQWARGIVMGVGPECNISHPTREENLKELDRVYFLKPWDGLIITEDGKDYFILERKDVLAIITT